MEKHKRKIRDRAFGEFGESMYGKEDWSHLKIYSNEVTKTQNTNFGGMVVV